MYILGRVSPFCVCCLVGHEQICSSTSMIKRGPLLNKAAGQYYFYLVFAAIFYGFITVGGQYFTNKGFSLYETSCLIFFVWIPYLPLLLIRPEFRIRKQRVGFFVSFGLIGALLQLTQFAGIVLGVPVAVVALLLYTQPVWTTILGKILLKEVVTFRKITALFLAIVGIIGLLNPFSQQFQFNILGVLAAVAAGLFLSLWVIWGRKSAIHSLHFLTTGFGYAFFSSVWLLILHPVVMYLIPELTFTRLDFSFYSHEKTAVVSFAFFAGILPAVLAFAGMKKVEASAAGLLLLFEPVSAAFLAFLFFGQPITTNVWFGAAFILLSNVLLMKNTSSL